MSCTSVFGQRNADCSLLSLHLLLNLSNVFLGAAILQEHFGQVAQAGAV